MNAVEMLSLRRLFGVSLANRIRNEEIRRMAGTSERIQTDTKYQHNYHCNAHYILMFRSS